MLSVLVCLGVLVADARPLAAQFGMWKGRPVVDVELEGWPSELDTDILDRLALRGERRLLFWRKSVDFYPNLLEDDRKRLQLHLARRGYPDASLDVRVVPTGQDADVKVVFQIQVGEPVRLRETRVEGWPDDLRPPPRIPDMLASGRPLHDEAVSTYRQELREVLLDQGHAEAKVLTEVQRRGPRSVDVVWTAEPGPRFHIGEVEVRGLPADLAALARESLGFEVGTLYSRQSIRRAEENLRLLRMFRRIRLSTTPQDSTALLLRCELEARPSQTVRFGTGYWTDDGPGGYTEWEHRNLLRRGRGVSSRIEWSLRLFLVRGSLTYPALFGARTWGLVSAEFRREEEDIYVLREERLSFEVVKPFSLTTRVRGGVIISQNDFDTDADVFDVEDPAGIVTRLRANLTRETADDILDPSRGTSTVLEVESAPPGLGSVAEYARVTAERARYVPLGARVTGVLRVGGGLAWPLGDSRSVLVNERLYAGGSRSVRGWRRRELGPVDAGGDPVGGESMVETSTELRFPLFKMFRGALFFDAGQVWLTAADVDLGDLATAAGAGIYARTPVGVFRADLGFPLQDPGPGEPDRVLHISIGQPF